ncbi:hypothetical protein C8R48DRAFT_733320 [Suillus tomentosus]|nr:hypothetical protein C8R48DRAFT_733320 [Suillus tomentosus]
MEAIKLVVGPPYGDVDDRVRAIAHALGLRTIIWQYAPMIGDYEYLIARAQNGTYATGGTIMLTHELNNFTMSEAMKFYTQLKAAFKYLVPMGVATNQTQPYVETNDSLPSFDQYISGTTTVTDGVLVATVGSSSSTGSGSSSGKTNSTGAASRALNDNFGILAAGAAFVGFSVKLLA